MVAGWVVSCSGWGSVSCSASGSESAAAAAAAAGLEVRGGTSSVVEELVILDIGGIGEGDV